MQFFADLDFLSWAATIGAVTVSAFVSFLVLRDWRNGWTIEPEAPFALVLFLGGLSLVGAAKSYSPDANAPTRQIEGFARFVGKVQGKGSFTEFICANSCQLTGGYALALHDEAANFVKIGSKYVFTYLEHPKGSIYTGISLMVIQISEPETGRVLYALDITNHPYRIVVYLFDFTLLVSTIVLEFALGVKQDRKGKVGSESCETENIEDRESLGPISLNLESKDPN